MVAKIKRIMKERNINKWLIFYSLIYVILVLKVITIRELNDSILISAYSIAISFYILSRFALGYLYNPRKNDYEEKYLPTISFSVPSKNEGENIRETIVRIAKSDYPKDKFDIIAVNDGSTDNTLLEMEKGKEIAERMGVTVKIIDWKENKGKREGMAKCAEISDKDIMFYIDSDSFIEKETARKMVKYFIDPKIGAVAGHTFVANVDVNFLTRMQAVRYYIAFRVYKATEAIFGTVTCCSGCCSAYRREYIMPILKSWQKQKFWGVTCTFGDDRSLTNFVLKSGYLAIYAPDVIAKTFVPENLRTYARQQMRWKKSWFRENLIAAGFMWKKNIFIVVLFYLGFILPLVTPIIVFRALLWYPFFHGGTPLLYLLGIMIMSVLYGLYYYIYTKDKKWMIGTLFSIYYAILLIWQLPWAIFNIRDTRWGTR